MYYLVRDYYDETKKKIFSDKDDIEECVDEYKDKPMLLVYSWEQGMYNDTRNGKRIYFDQYYILKKSDNVFDFIEVGDLVEFNWSYGIGKVTNNSYHKAFCEITINKTLGVVDENILKFYKLNKNGNYIKVWERGNENDR